MYTPFVVRNLQDPRRNHGHSSVSPTIAGTRQYSFPRATHTATIASGVLPAMPTLGLPLRLVALGREQPSYEIVGRVVS